MLRPGDILLAEDTAGTGHSWRLVDENPWRRAYVILAPGVEVPFVAKPQALPADQQTEAIMSCRPKTRRTRRRADRRRHHERHARHLAQGARALAHHHHVRDA